MDKWREDPDYANSLVFMHPSFGEIWCEEIEQGSKVLSRKFYYEAAPQLQSKGMTVMPRTWPQSNEYRFSGPDKPNRTIKHLIKQLNMFTYDKFLQMLLEDKCQIRL